MDSSLAAYITWDFDPVLFHLGGFQIRYYGVLFASAIYIGYLLMKWQFMRGGISEEKADHFFLYSTLGIVIGARLGHVLFYEPGPFFNNPLEIFKIWHGGLASHGATLGIMIAIWIFVKRHKVPIIEVTDRVAMSVAAGSSCVRLGNFLNGEIVGKVSDAPWAVVFKQYDNQPRIPSQLVEITVGIAVFLILFFVDRHYREKRPRGIMTALFFICYFTMRFFVELLKEYQVDWLIQHNSPVTMGQLLSIPFVILGAVILYFSIKKWHVPVVTAPAGGSRGRPGYVKKKKKK